MRDIRAPRPSSAFIQPDSANPVNLPSEANCLDNTVPCPYVALKKKDFIMRLLKKLGQLLVPERTSDDRTRDMKAPETLLLVYQKNAQLAEQIESHAELAPYPQVAEQLRRIADEKRDLGNRLRKIIEDLHGSTREAPQSPAIGKNHWQRLIRDLEEQRKLDDIVARYEFTLIPQISGGSEFFDELKRAHDRHRQSLIRLIALADPQASQT